MATRQPPTTEASMSRRTVRPALVATLAVLLLAPAAAQAFTIVSYDGSNGLNVIGDGSGSDISTDARTVSGAEEYVVGGTDPNSLLPGGGSVRSADGQVLECQLGAARKMTANLGAGDDLLGLGVVGGNLGPTTVNGGDGNDRIGGSSVLSPLIIDGGNGDDFLLGGSAADTFNGGEGNDNMHLNAGADNASGGNGN